MADLARVPQTRVADGGVGDRQPNGRASESMSAGLTSALLNDERIDQPVVRIIDVERLGISGTRIDPRRGRSYCPRRRS